MDTARIYAIAKKAALENAIKHKGRANQGAVIGSVMQEYPDAKQDMKTTAREVGKIIAEVNSLNPEEQENELLALDPNYFAKEEEKKQERKEKRQELPDLKDAEEGKVVMRICPEPSKYNHLGHALNFLINYLYAQKYNGKCILRFDDTNPEKESQEYVDAMQEDVLKYLNIKPDQTVFVSDHMPKYYEACEYLIQKNLAYACDCPSESISKNRREMQECECRKQTNTKQEWKNMLAGKSKKTLRLKIDMQHKNAVMRDPVIMRVVTKEHYRQGNKYKVWPMYDFESALEDSWLGTTHILRSNEFETRIELQNHIQDLFGLPHQHIKQYGRFNIVGATTKGREIRELIENGEAIGWDDPKLVTLRALKRRGITREAFVDLAKQSGMSKQPTNIGFEQLAAINRKILDEEANRYFFVEDPVEIVVEKWPEDLNEIELKLHPHNNRGGRTLKLDGAFVISKEDFEAVESGKVFRLIDTINLQYQEGKFVVHSKSIDEFKQEKNKYGLIHFLPANEKLVDVEIFMPDHSLRKGKGEPLLTQLREGAHIQFERVCFARLDERKIQEKNKLVFWYSHE